MGELVRLVIDCLQFIWPFRIVWADEQGGFFVCGKWRKAVGPGLYPVIPYFMEIKALSISKGIVGTARVDIPLSDDRQISFSASATARVVDVKLALLAMDDYKETTQELLTGVLADKVMEVDAERIVKWEKRGRLKADLLRWVQEEATEYGLELTKLRFTSLVLNTPNLRILNDSAPVSQW